MRFWQGGLQTWLLIGAGALLVVGVAIAIVIALVSRKRASGGLLSPELAIDLDRLSSEGPSPLEATLHVYGTPVRVAVVIVAPVGRATLPPSATIIPDILDQIVPGIAGVMATQEPREYVWPTQLSSQGFSHSFFNNVALPGDRGKGSPWCGIAGKALGPTGQSLLVALVCTAGFPNNLGQIIIQHEGQWLDVLRVQAPVT